MIIDKKDLRDLRDMIISALRYSLGRRTYITDETAKFIKRYPRLIDERMRDVMLKDLEKYFRERESFKFDDECDFNTWKSLYNWLKGLEEDERKRKKNKKIVR